MTRINPAGAGFAQTSPAFRDRGGILLKGETGRGKIAGESGAVVEQERDAVIGVARGVENLAGEADLGVAGPQRLEHPRSRRAGRDCDGREGRDYRAE